MSLITLVPFAMNPSPAEMTVFSPSTPGATDKMVQANSDFEYLNDGRTAFLINNSTGSPTTVNFTIPAGTTQAVFAQNQQVLLSTGTVALRHSPFEPPP